MRTGVPHPLLVCGVSTDFPRRPKSGAVVRKSMQILANISGRNTSQLYAEPINGGAGAKVEGGTLVGSQNIARLHKKANKRDAVRRSRGTHWPVLAGRLSTNFTQSQ